MMNARNVKAALVAFVATLMCAAPAAHAAVYKWTDENGTATYSTQPPAEPDKVRDLKVLEGLSSATAPPRREAHAVEHERRSASTQSKPQSSYTRAPVKFSESFRSEPPGPAGDNQLTRQELDDAARDIAHAHARGRTEAVRDPCLISSDPKCHERNKDRYHPYLGYAPSVMQPGSTSAAGATTGASGGGAVGAHVVREATASTRRVDPAAPVGTGVR